MRISLEQQFAISSAPDVLRDFKSCSLLPLVTFQIRKNGEWVKGEREKEMHFVGEGHRSRRGEIEGTTAADRTPFWIEL